jgi:hypothetical protein
MSLVEIENRFQSAWVLIEDPQTTGTFQVKGGRVLWHSSDRNEVYRKARELHPRHSAILYTGKVSRDTTIIL